MILTDGMENASKEYNRAGIFALLKEKEASGWGIIYLGANQDAYQEAMGMGIQITNTVNFAVSQTSRAMAGAARIATGAFLRTGKTDGLMDEVDKDELLKPADDIPPVSPTRKRKRPN